MNAEPRLILAFTVAGVVPKPKGSLTGMSNKGTTHVRMKESVDPDGVFRTAVCRAAYLEAIGTPAPELTDYRAFKARAARVKTTVIDPGVPVETRMTFLLPKPRTGGSAPTGHFTGDIEKLQRNVHDALQDASVLADDSQVVRVKDPEKLWVDEDCFEQPGVYVEVREWLHPHARLELAASRLCAHFEGYQRWPGLDEEAREFWREAAKGVMDV